MKTLALLTIGLLSIPSFAQELNIRHLNDETNSLQKLSSSEKESKGYFGKTFSFKASLPKSRKLKRTEKSQKELIKCVEKIIKKKKGGNNTLTVAENILNMAMENNSLSQNTGTLEKAKNECTHYYYELTTPKKGSVVDYDQMPLNRGTKVGQFIGALTSKRPEICSAPGVRIKAGFVVGASVGLQEIKCLLEDGNVRNYLSAEVGFIGGFGAQISFQGRDEDYLDENDIYAGDFVAGYASSSDDGSVTFQFPVGSIDLEDGATKEGPTFGLGYLMSGYEAGGGIRVINGKRRWGWLLDQLK